MTRAFKVTERYGDLSFGVLWVSLDGRLMSNWYRTYKEALEQYKHLKQLKREPSFHIRIPEEELKSGK